MEALGVSPERARAVVQATVGKGEQTPSGHMPFTARTKKALDLSLREALQLGHNYIGTEHLLLGIIREGGLTYEGADLDPAAPLDVDFGAAVLTQLGVELTVARKKVIEILNGYRAAATPPPLAPPQPAGVTWVWSEQASEDTALLREIRDLLKAQAAPVISVASGGVVAAQLAYDVAQRRLIEATEKAAKAKKHLDDLQGGAA